MYGTRYHSFLKVFALVVAIVLLFDGGFVAPITKEFSDNAINYLASVGTSVSANIAPTELNTLTAELTKREQELNAREAELQAREIATRNFSEGAESNDYSIYILSLILFILTVLIIVNYMLDWMRIKNTRYEEKMA